MTTPTYTLYLDETGDPSLEKINLEYPIFALGGLIIENSLESALQTKLEELKQRIFGRTDLVLHSTDLRKQRGGFAMLGNIPLRQQFYSEFNDFIAAAPITFMGQP